jgi:hypothetical protein
MPDREIERKEGEKRDGRDRRKEDFLGRII